jgi:L-lactate dehydrogenase
MDPAAFGGAENFIRQISWTANACRSNPPAPGIEAVRLPGAGAHARRRQALAEGVRLHPGIMETLAPFAEKHGIAVPGTGA